MDYIPDAVLNPDTPDLREPPRPPIPEVSPIEGTTAEKPLMEWRDQWEVFPLEDAFKPRAPTEYIIDGLFRIPSLNIPYGSPGSLKTLFMMYLSVCVAAGLPCLFPAPWKTGTNPRKTIQKPSMWIDFDNGKDIVFERFEAIARALKVDPTKIPFFIYSMPRPWLNATEAVEIGNLINRIKSHEAGFVTIDNLGTVRGDADENSAEMQTIMSHFRQTVEETRTVLNLIHHQRKSPAIGGGREGDKLRGHSSIEQAIDLALMIERETLSDIISVKSTKTRSTNIYPFQAAFTYTQKEDTSLETALFFGLPGNDDESDRAIQNEIMAAFVLPDSSFNKTALVNSVKTNLPKVGTNRIRNQIDFMALQKRILETPGKNNTERIYTKP